MLKWDHLPGTWQSLVTCCLSVVSYTPPISFFPKDRLENALSSQSLSKISAEKKMSGFFFLWSLLSRLSLANLCLFGVAHPSLLSMSGSSHSHLELWMIFPWQGWLTAAHSSCQQQDAEHLAISNQHPHPNSMRESTPGGLPPQSGEASPDHSRWFGFGGARGRGAVRCEGTYCSSF